MDFKGGAPDVVEKAPLFHDTKGFVQGILKPKPTTQFYSDESEASQSQPLLVASPTAPGEEETILDQESIEEGYSMLESGPLVESEALVEGPAASQEETILEALVEGQAASSIPGR